MKGTLSILCAALFLCGCSPEKRLQRFLAKHQQFNDTITVTVRDTVVIPGDTVFRAVAIRSTDTVTVTNERQTVRIVRVPTGSPCDTAVFRANVLATLRPDTVYMEKTVEVPRIVPCDPNDVASWWRWAAIIMAALLLVLYLINRYLPKP